MNMNEKTTLHQCVVLIHVYFFIVDKSFDRTELSVLDDIFPRPLQLQICSSEVWMFECKMEWSELFCYGNRENRRYEQILSKDFVMLYTLVRGFVSE